jgi:hypothetical protein
MAMEQESTLTICATTGAVLTETLEGVTMPADYSFASVNDYVHGTCVGESHSNTRQVTGPATNVPSRLSHNASFTGRAPKRAVRV